ncbi:MAG: HAMP domain-containing histidine kinase [Verrucomicrobiales bacterium]|nr:HAMP domain-containing histidine kinase [Verrucomicrobiales bacterium]
MIALPESAEPRGARPRLFLLGLLGSLPILLVGVFGLQSLRREEVIALHDAREAARAAAPRLAAAIHGTLLEVSLPSRADIEAFERRPGPASEEPTARLGEGLLAVFVAEDYTYPDVRSEPPRPSSFDPFALPGDLGKAWDQLASLALSDASRKTTSRAWGALADRVGESPAGLVVQYRYARALAEEGRTAEALPILEAIVAGAGRQAGATGLPLDILALRTMLEILDAQGSARSKHIEWLDAYCQRVLLKWRLPAALLQEWESNYREQIRAWEAAALRHAAVREKLVPLLSPPPSDDGSPKTLRLAHPSWVEDGATPGGALVTRHEGPNGTWYLLRSAVQIDRRVEEVVRRSGVPDAFAVAVTVYGRECERGQPEESVGAHGEWLATAEVPGNPLAAVTVRLRIEKPLEFLVPVRRRVMGFAVLIALASVTSVIAVVMALCAWERQRRWAEMQSGFVASVTHELRAPLASVRLLAEELVDLGGDHPGRRDRYLRLIVRETQRLGFLVENVLRHARLERARDHLESAEVDLREVVQQSAESVRPVAEERQVKVTTQVPDDPILAEVDAPAMQQVLVNLIDNALKHSPSGASIDVGVDRAEGGEVCLWVVDRGAGIPKDEQARLFDAFYRRGSELRRETPGVGLGLTIVKRIVKAHGGQVMVESAPGAGARFEVRLPEKPPNHEG